MTETTYRTIEEAIMAAMEEIKATPFSVGTMVSDKVKRIRSVEGGFRVEGTEDLPEMGTEESLVGYVDHTGFESVESMKSRNS